jgi:hypothetical protein
MECTVTLNCESPIETVAIDMQNATNKIISKTQVSDETRFLENGWYYITISSCYKKSDVVNVEIYLNGHAIGIGTSDDIVELDNFLQIKILFYKNNSYKSQPFLLQYDLIQMTVVFDMSNGSQIIFNSDYYLCMSKDVQDTENISSIIEALVEFDDERISQWIFGTDRSYEKVNSLIEGAWREKAYKSIYTLIQLLEKILACYQENFTFFKSSARHNIVQEQILSSYEKVRSIRYADFTWLMQNSNLLAQSSSKTAILYNNKYYIPYKIRTEESKNNFNIYENQIVVSFLSTVCNYVNMAESELHNGINEEKLMIECLHGFETDGYRSSTLTISRIQVQIHQELLEKIRNIKMQLNFLLILYTIVLPCQQIKITSLPRKTNTFREIYPYSKIFGLILQWYKYGEFDLKKENVILRIKTLDKLFEYYCLHRLLKMLTMLGFDIDKAPNALRHFIYKATKENYDDQNITNTFVLRSDSIKIILYYQPVIYSNGFENEITLFRTTDKNNFFNPDFLLKIINETSANCGYALFDAKFSTRKTIKEYEIKDTIFNYSSQVSGINLYEDSLKMMWLLQGRIDGTKNLYRFHSSPLSKMYRPLPSYGIYSINTNIKSLDELWKEIQLCFEISL